MLHQRATCGINSCALYIIEIDLQLTREKRRADGGMLTIRIKEAPLVQGASAALGAAGKAREKILANLASSDTGGRLLDIIPSLGPFIEIADKIATVRVNISNTMHVCSDFSVGSPIRERCMASHIVNH